MEISTVKINFNVNTIGIIAKREKKIQINLHTARTIFIPFWIGGAKTKIEKKLFRPTKVSFIFLAMEAIKGNVGLCEGFPSKILNLKIPNSRYVVLPKIEEKRARDGFVKFITEYVIRRYSLLPKVSVGEIALVYKPFWYIGGSSKFGKTFLLIDAEIGEINYNLRDSLFDELINHNF